MHTGNMPASAGDFAPCARGYILCSIRKYSDQRLALGLRDAGCGGVGTVEGIGIEAGREGEFGAVEAGDGVFIEPIRMTKGIDTPSPWLCHCPNHAIIRCCWRKAAKADA